MAKKNYSLEAKKLIKEHTLYSIGSGFIPVIGLDIMANTAIQMELTRKMCQLYHLKYEEAQLRSLLNALVGSTAARIYATGTKSLLKLIPGVGSMVGGVVVGLYAAASTYASGEVFKMHIEKGGTLKDFDAKAMQKYYKIKLDEGMKMVEKWRKER
ncbi:MAG: DUF697 domain-containing protein [Bacteroidota bacterium]